MRDLYRLRGAMYLFSRPEPVLEATSTTRSATSTGTRLAPTPGELLPGREPAPNTRRAERQRKRTPGF